jgi:hypothetical protein
MMEKSHDHKALYMPLWSLEELQLANASLNLGFTDQDIESRFSFSGGTARLCLAPEPETYALDVQLIKGMLEQIDSYSKLMDLLKNPGATKSISHRVLYMTPVNGLSNLPTRYKIEICSLEVIKLIVSNIKALLRRAHYTRVIYGRIA